MAFISQSTNIESVFLSRDDYDTLFSKQLWLWGTNTYGQLGDNTTTHKSSPVQTVTGGTDWKQVACGESHTAAIKTDGTLWTWGRNDFGQLGDNTTTPKSSPVQTVAGGNNWKQVACSMYNTAAIKTDGTLWLCGYNNAGQIGDNTTTHKSSPVQTVAGGNNWKQVAGGESHIAAIKTDGTLWLWGRNLYGELGDTTRTNRSSPIQTVAGGSNWKQVACGNYHTLAIRADGVGKAGGRLWSWGRNLFSPVTSYGMLGDGTDVHKSSPVQIVASGTTWKKVTAGYSHSAGLRDGSNYPKQHIYIWGYSASGELANGMYNASYDAPVEVMTEDVYDWVQIASGWTHMAAIKSDGSLWGWGSSTNGALGGGFDGARSRPIQTLDTGKYWKQVACGSHFTAALKAV